MRSNNLKNQVFQTALTVSLHDLYCLGTIDGLDLNENVTKKLQRGGEV